MRDAIDMGIRPTNHTDFVVAPLDQITPLEGLKTMTIWAAEQYNEEMNKGSLKVGKLAARVILDNNPLTVAPAKIKDIKIVETIKEGNTIYSTQ